jgi:hypothetical protein
MVDNDEKRLKCKYYMELKQINKRTIKIFDSSCIRVLQVLLKECSSCKYHKPRKNTITSSDDDFKKNEKMIFE